MSEPKTDPAPDITVSEKLDTIMDQNAELHGMVRTLTDHVLNMTTELNRANARLAEHNHRMNGAARALQGDPLYGFGNGGE